MPAPCKRPRKHPCPLEPGPCRDDAALRGGRGLCPRRLDAPASSAECRSPWGRDTRYTTRSLILRQQARQGFGQPGWLGGCCVWGAAEGKPLRQITGAASARALPGTRRPLRLRCSLEVMTTRGGKTAGRKATFCSKGHREPLTTRSTFPRPNSPDGDAGAPGSRARHTAWQQRILPTLLLSGSGCVGALEGRGGPCLPVLPRLLELLPVQKPVDKNQ